MEAFKGPLGSHLNYIKHIAINNCIDYFNLFDSLRENGGNNTSDKYKRLRYFLNAIDSLNNIPEYFFHEFKGIENWQDDQLYNTIGSIRSNHKILRDIEQMANAYKHCIRKKQSDLQANDMQSVVITAEVKNNGVKVSFDFESIEDEEIMGEAFRFWVDYLNNPDKKKLLPQAHT